MQKHFQLSKTYHSALLSLYSARLVLTVVYVLTLICMKMLPISLVNFIMSKELEECSLIICCNVSICVHIAVVRLQFIGDCFYLATVSLLFLTVTTENRKYKTIIRWPSVIQYFRVKFDWKFVVAYNSLNMDSLREIIIVSSFERKMHRLFEYINDKSDE